MDAAMMSLREYRNGAAHLADFLPWAALVGTSVVLNKDGSFQRTARFRGPDLDSATPAELVATTARLNNALRRLGSGWAIFVEAQRTPALDYPDRTFPIRSRRWSIWSGANSFAKKARISRATI
jgi:type IV secretion system protein VirB4